jgi:hypothetical protein
MNEFRAARAAVSKRVAGEVVVKARYLVAASVLAGTALGVAVTWADFRHSPTRMFPGPPPVADSTGVPKLVVDKADHDFGYVEGGTLVRHTFRIRNAGTGTLTLKAGVTTCSACTIANLSKSRVRPGESSEVVVEYAAKSHNPEFRHTAFVLTNDPKQPRIELNINGKISARFRVDPDRLVFSRVSASEPASADLRVYSFISDDLRVSDPEFLGAETRDFFTAQIEPLPAEKLAEVGAKSGQRVVVSLKPGLPLGPFRQTIRLALASGESRKPTEWEVSIDGSVVSDLTVLGPGWSAESGILTIGTVKRAEGAKRRLTILVRGSRRGEVEVEPTVADPPWIRVTAGKSTRLNESANQIPLEVEIPPGQGPAVYLGTGQGKFGEIVLSVKNQPDVKQIRLRVKFVIGNGE